MFGYSSRKRPFYCNFRYEDNTTKCLQQAVLQTSLITVRIWPKVYICTVKRNDRIPSHVMLSTNPGCDQSHWSAPIPVWNGKSAAPEGIGVCVHGCLYTTDGNSEKILKSMVQFLAMVKVLGAKLVTVYSLNIENAVLEKIWDVYPGFVDIVQWVNLNKTLHYYGQRLSLNDCIYRNMKKVKYLAMIDLDEMILPASTNSWPEMLQALDKRGRFTSFTFSNNFFEEVPASTDTLTTLQEGNQTCPYISTLPMYFTRLKRLPWPGFKQNTKMKMIVKPALLSVSCIHDVCKPTVPGYLKTYRVPQSMGLMAHYREPVPQWYVYGKGQEDRTALKHQQKVMAEIREICSRNTNTTYAWLL